VVGGRGQRARFEPADVAAPVHRAAHEAGPFEHLDVLGRRGEGDRVWSGELPEHLLACGESAHHRPPGALGEGVEHRVHLFNHSVEGRGLDVEAMVNHIVN
jgi:hypothetical protein